MKGATESKQAAIAAWDSFKSCPREGGNKRRRTKIWQSDSSFKSCPREGGNFQFVQRADRLRPVSSHAPVKGATLDYVQLLRATGVSSHAPVKGATRGTDREPVRRSVSSHAPVKGATFKVHRSFVELSVLSFKSCPREGGNDGHRREHGGNPRVSSHAPVKGATDMLGRQFADGLVSSHAPVKGATRVDRLAAIGREVSSHAPVKGATAEQHAVLDMAAGFKSCPREGGNHQMLRFFRSSGTVSSHAPVKGATLSVRIRLMSSQFQVMPP